MQRWVEGPEGRMELIELPLTPELFLNPRLEDKILQGHEHERAVDSLRDRLVDHLESADPRVIVLCDLKHLISPGRGPAPDISIVLRPQAREAIDRSYSVARQGVPDLIVEVLSPISAPIRHTDEVGKVALYARVGVPVYLLVDLPREGNGERCGLKGYRLGPNRRYVPMKPDSRGRFVSEATGLAFAVAPDGKGIDIFDLRTGERVLSPQEKYQREAARAEREAAARKREAAARKAAERKVQEEAARAEREAEARRAAEDELARLRAEVERLKGSR